MKNQKIKKNKKRLARHTKIALAWAVMVVLITVSILALSTGLSAYREKYLSRGVWTCNIFEEIQLIIQQNGLTEAGQSKIEKKMDKLDFEIKDLIITDRADEVLYSYRKGEGQGEKYKIVVSPFGSKYNASMRLGIEINNVAKNDGRAYNVVEYPEESTSEMYARQRDKETLQAFGIEKAFSIKALVKAYYELGISAIVGQVADPESWSNHAGADIFYHDVEAGKLYCFPLVEDVYEEVWDNEGGVVVFDVKDQQHRKSISRIFSDNDDEDLNDEENDDSVTILPERVLGGVSAEEFEDAKKYVEWEMQEDKFAQNNLMYIGQLSRGEVQNIYLSYTNDYEEILGSNSVLRFANDWSQLDFSVTQVFLLIVLWFTMLYWVFKDSRMRAFSPVVWACLTLVTGPVALLIYLLVRPGEVAKCENCEAPQRKNNIYCPMCGTPQSAVCRNCGHKLGDEDLYCAHCGTPREDIEFKDDLEATESVFPEKAGQENTGATEE